MSKGVTQKRQVAHARRVIRDFCRKNGLLAFTPGCPSDTQILAIVERSFQISPPKAGTARCGRKTRLIDAARAVQGQSPLTAKPKARPVQHDKAKRFYSSAEWKRLRYDVLAENDGCCELCGRGRNEGEVLNVDHIKPLKANWSLRNDPNNLQILCGTCNAGKGNRDDTDWRSGPSEPRLAVLMGEAVE